MRIADSRSQERVDRNKKEKKRTLEIDSRSQERVDRNITNPEFIRFSDSRSQERVDRNITNPEFIRFSAIPARKSGWIEIRTWTLITMERLFPLARAGG